MRNKEAMWAGEVRPRWLWRRVAALFVPMALAGAVLVAQPATADTSNFIMGVDMGLLNDNEAGGCTTLENGVAKDTIQLFADAGANLGRVRLWVDPYSATGQPYGGGTNDLASTIATAQRYKDAGMEVMLDIHYSDWWADPGHQKKPKAWDSLSFAALTTQVHDYTQSVIAAMKAAGVLPDMVQIGNETTNGLLFGDGSSSDWSKVATLLKAGISGMNEALAAGDHIETILHLDAGGYNGHYRTFFDNMTSYGVPYDIIGLSYYTFWGHGPVSGLAANVNDISVRYNKDVMIVEAGTAWTSADYDYGNLVDAIAVSASPYGGSMAGQARYLRDMVQIMKNVPDGHGRGVVYWEPEWRGCPTSVTWGTSAGIAYGGNAGTPSNMWDNIAMFDWTGRPNAALEVYSETLQSNAVTNPGFETDTATTGTPAGWLTWTNSAGAIKTEQTAFTGAWKLTHWESTAYQAMTWQDVTVANGTYRVSAWVKSSGGQNQSYLWVKNHGGAEQHATLPGGTSEWQLVTAYVTVTTGHVELGFYSDANAGNWVNVDSVRLTPRT